MADPRDTDLVLAPNEYVFVSDSNSGIIKPVVGPTKKTLDSTEQTMLFNPKTQQFVRVAPKDAVQLFPVVDERSYLVLENPAVAASGEKEHPTKGVDNTTPSLRMGQKMNIPGPATFPLWPGQTATVIEGHQLRSNQYLVCVVHNAKEAKANWGKAVVDAATDADPNAVNAGKIVTGQILIIKGTEVSYYIPPTGVNVVPDNKGFIRDAVTLERLEYCILLDESGDKRYVKGPAVVFPKPTETFIEKNSARKFDAIELNDNMGIYIKVIADYSEDGKSYKAGDEIFVTGKELKIYYPRAEHAIIKYDDQIRHYAVAIPKGEARYVLDKDTGDVKTVKGPMMFMPDPRKEVIVRRILSDHEVGLWFPGNLKAVEHNRVLREQAATVAVAAFAGPAGSKGIRSHKLSSSSSLMEESQLYSMQADFAADDMQRQNTFTPPRTITLDSKFDGGVNINVWPGYAVQVVSKNGKRKLVSGPESVILEYDETLEIMELSTGKPKSDAKLIETCYLRVKNNRISDVIEADTKDMVHVQARVNYRMNFEDGPEQWFSVENYVKFLTQNLRSIVRNEIQKHGIEDVAQNATPIIRDIVLGVTVEKGKERPGRAFPENGMHVYDVEVLSLEIGDAVIRDKLTAAQHTTVQRTLEVASKKQELVAVQAIESCIQDMAKAKAETRLCVLDTDAEVDTKTNEIVKAKKIVEKLLTQMRDEIEDISRKIVEKNRNLEIGLEKQEIDMAVDAFERKFKAFTPDLVKAIEQSGENNLLQTFVEHIPEAGGGLGLLFGNKLLDNLAGMLGDTPAGRALQRVVKGQK